MDIALQDAFTISFWTNIILLIALAVMWMMGGEWITANLRAWKTKGIVVLEWTKTRRWKPFSAKVIKAMGDTIDLPDGRGPLEIRREAIGTQGNKIPMVLFPTEFNATISPQEISGEHYYNPIWGENIFYAYLWQEELKQITEEQYKSGKYPLAKLWCKHPPQVLSADQFVKHQKINPNPLLMEAYGDYKKNKLYEQMTNPLRDFMTSNFHYIIITLVVVGLVWMWVGNNDSAVGSATSLAQCQETIANMYQSGTCKVTQQAVNAVNASVIKTGGAIV